MPHLKISVFPWWKPRKTDPPKVSNQKGLKRENATNPKNCYQTYIRLAWHGSSYDLMILANRALGVDAVGTSSMMKALGSSGGWRQVLHLMSPFTESLVVTHG